MEKPPLSSSSDDSKRSGGPGHVRRTSEPPDRVEEVEQTQDRRSMLERHWSMGNVTGQTLSRGVGGRSSAQRSLSVATQQPAQDATEMAHFHQSWTNVDSTDFLGASLSSLDFGASAPQLLDSHCATLQRGISLGSPKVDSSGVSSVIHDAARITDWEKVLHLCRTQPEHAKYSGRDGWTALHHACNRRCPHAETVEALIRAYPNALLQEEDKGWLPLHYACRFKTPKDVVRLLLQLYPEKGRVAVSKRDRWGRTPLYYAIRYDAPTGVVGLLLQVDPSAVLEEDQNEDSPLALVWDSFAEKLEGKRIVHSFLPGGFLEPEDTTVEERAELLRQRLQKEPKLRKRWTKVNMLLKAAFGFPVEEEDDETNDNAEDETKVAATTERKWRIVHATAAVKCHLSLFLLACALHPEQAQELDENDLRRPGERFIANGGVGSHQTALHLAASSNAGGEPGKTVVISLLSMYREAAQVQDGIDGSLPLHRMVENERKQDWPNHAAILYHFYPRAVQIPDHHGKLPLHRAAAAIKHIERGDEDDAQERSVIIQLVRSFSQAASHADHSGCLPFHLIAMHGKVWDDDVEAVYNTHRVAVQVRAGPSLHNRLPIHLAAASELSSESLIQRLVHLHPRGASMEDGQGKLPLHLACEIGKEWDNGVRCIHQAFPQSVEMPEDNSRGWLPLHMASSSSNASAGLIAKLVELHPLAAETADHQGRFPLHLACVAGKSWLGGLEVLFEAGPAAIGTRDDKGLLPFHIAALQSCKKHDNDNDDASQDESETILTKAELQAANEKEAAELDIIYNLLRADPTTVPQAEAPPSLASMTTLL